MVREVKRCGYNQNFVPGELSSLAPGLYASIKSSYLKSSSLKLLDQFLPDCFWGLLSKGYLTAICSNSSAPFSKMAVMPIYGKMSSSLKSFGQFSLDFVWGLMSKGHWLFVQMVPHLWTRWPPCPYMVKYLKIFFSRTKKALRFNLGRWHWGLNVYQVCSYDDSSMIFDLSPQDKICVPIHFYGENVIK